MLEKLSTGFQTARKFLNGQALLTEANISQALLAVRDSLLQADVDVAVADLFLERIKQDALGQEVQVSLKKKKISPAQYFIKICQDELVRLMGPATSELKLSKPVASVMMVGLQGSGKTTSCAKLANYYKKKGYQPLLVAADIYRPAAVKQLQVLGDSLNVPVYSKENRRPEELCSEAFSYAREHDLNLIIFDTAGRLAIDEELMLELRNIRQSSKPDQILLVVDSMIGRDASRTAAEFNRQLDLDGFILTKLDGDARGGAALSIKEISGKPIKFLGMGEKFDQLEEFRPEGLASRILGMGDVVSLVKDFEEHVDEAKAEKEAAKLLKGQFSFEDFLSQIKLIRRMGPIAGLMEKLPGMGEHMPQIRSGGDAQIKKIESMILSMTQKERRSPELFARQKTRVGRVAKGSGVKESEVQGLLTQFQGMKSMMQKIGKMGFGRQMPVMPGMPSMSAMPAAPNILLKNPKSLADRKTKRKRAKLARKKNKKR